MKLILGTAQFGLDYGINNFNGKVSSDAVLDILKRAYAGGVSALDTAAMYGESEKVIGNNIGRKDVPYFDIMTKLPDLDAVIDIQPACRVENTFIKSISSLGLKQVDTLYLHRASNMHSSDFSGEYYKSLLGLKEKGLVKKIGISVYSTVEMEAIDKKYLFDVVQVPTNVFDQRWLNSKFLKKFRDNSGLVYGRSMFLQGLLLMSLNSIPEFFQPILSKIKQWQEFCANRGMSKLEACINFIRSCSGIDGVIFGVDNLKHLDEILTLLSKKELFSADINTYKKFSVSDEKYINPAMWDFRK